MKNTLDAFGSYCYIDLYHIDSLTPYTDDDEENKDSLNTKRSTKAAAD
jgi:hypothetical protein